MKRGGHGANGSRVAASKGVSFSKSPVLAVSLPTWRSRVVLFVLFPRVAPLWGLPGDAMGGRSGLSDSMQVGSSLKYCRIAEGLADAYPKFASIWFWDTAAAQCVLQQAGGSTLSLEDFVPVRYQPDASLRTPAFIAVGDATRNWRELLQP